MVNVFQRLARRASNLRGTSPDPGKKSPDTTLDRHSLHRRTSASSAKHSHQEPAHVPRHLYVISDTRQFNRQIIDRFQAEGFAAEYIPHLPTGDPERDRKALEHAIREKEDDLESGERYAIIGTSVFRSALLSYLQIS